MHIETNNAHLKLHLTMLGNPFIKDELEVHIWKLSFFFKNTLLSL